MKERQHEATVHRNTSERRTPFVRLCVSRTEEGGKPPPEVIVVETSLGAAVRRWWQRDIVPQLASAELSRLEDSFELAPGELTDRLRLASPLELSNWERRISAVGTCQAAWRALLAQSGRATEDVDARSAAEFHELRWLADATRMLSACPPLVLEVPGPFAPRLAAELTATAEQLPHVEISLWVSPRWMEALRNSPRSHFRAFLLAGSSEQGASASSAIQPDDPVPRSASHIIAAQGAAAPLSNSAPEEPRPSEGQALKERARAALEALGFGPDESGDVRQPESSPVGAEREETDSTKKRDRDLGEARSLAEKLLYEMLEAHPGSRGAFRLNVRMPFEFGRSAAELDLYCASAALCVEVDGPLHYNGPEAYRRDRRKDLLLQQQRIWVIRVLAQDVVYRADFVLSLVLGALRERMLADGDRSKGSCP